LLATIARAISFRRGVVAQDEYVEGNEKPKSPMMGGGQLTTLKLTFSVLHISF
jgi:hypothetical protein